MDLSQLKTSKNSDVNRFELNLGSTTAFIDYKIGKSGNWYLIHTEVPPEFKSQGVGSKLVRESLNLLQGLNVKIIPSCPFVRAYIKRHEDDYHNLLASGVKL